jgi:glycosyltransferase involved in cell wall biosynthesis
MKYDDRQASRTVLIIPVYNEDSVIFGVVENAKKHFKHIVCVNDGSKDNSRSEILRSGAYLVDHPINMGQGAALQTGIEFARQIENIDYFVTFDADGQHRINDVKQMLARIHKGDVDIVLGSRFLGKTIGMKRSKKVLLKVATRFSNVLSGVKLTDTHNGLRVFNRHVAETMQITMPDMAHASEILDIIARQKYRYTEVPVIIEYTDYSRSKGQAMINAVNIGFDAILRKISK